MPRDIRPSGRRRCSGLSPEWNDPSGTGEFIDHSRAVARRRVAKDRTVTLNGRLFEAPVASSIAVNLSIILIIPGRWK